MARKRFLWQIYPLLLTATLLALAATAVYAVRSFEAFFSKQTAVELENTARLVGLMVTAMPDPLDPRALDALCKETGRDVAKRITLILPSGKVAGDSEEDPGAMENHGERPEVRDALARGVGIATRSSHTLGREMMYVALPVKRKGIPLAVVRTAMPVKAVSNILHPLDIRIALEGLVIALLAASVILLLLKRFMRPLEEIRVGALHFQEGDLSYRLRIRGPAEVASLAETMNQMAAKLQVQIDRLKKIETLRSEFVANVSHELKTPVTSIRGFAETLCDGAMDNPQRARQYLEIIASHAGRLSTIIEDLLQLARLEPGEERHQIPIERGEIQPVLEAAIATCADRATAGNVRVECNCAERLSAPINPTLLEQALVNLIDNAIKYSDAGGAVCVEACTEGDEICIAVRDNGIGIPEEHQPRIFERFYRVDKGRSRALGGTGLGLSIVKHIVSVHGGRIEMESAPGQGSTFRIRLPRAS